MTAAILKMCLVEHFFCNYPLPNKMILYLGYRTFSDAWTHEYHIIV